MAKLTKKQETQITSKALLTAAKQLETKGVALVPAGSYPFDFEARIIGELNVNKGSKAGEDIEVIDFSIADVLRGVLATSEDPEKLVSDALGWHKDADKNAKKSADGDNAAVLLKVAKRRRMTTMKGTPAKAGSASAKPAVKIKGSVGSREVSMEVEAA